VAKLKRARSSRLMNRLENIGDTFYEMLCFQRPRRWNENRPYIKRLHRIKMN
jgi:hypothetical protein